MKINRIEISIDDPNLLTQLAPFMDKPEFLADIEDIRKNSLYMSGLYNKQLIKELWRLRSSHRNKSITKEQFLLFIDTLSKKYVNVSEEPLSFDMPLSYAIAEVNELIGKYCKSHAYVRAVVYAILCGKINQNDYKANTYTMHITAETIKNWMPNPDINYVTIVINPESTPNEVEKEYRAAYAEFFPNKNISRGLGKSRNNRLKRVSNDPVTNIKRNREWYWLYLNKKLNGMSYEKIRINTEKKDRPATWQGVQRAINRYKTLIDNT